MAEYQNVFKRKEKKYLLTAQQYQTLLPQLQGYMNQDEHGLHTICNLYFDTDRYDLIRHSIEKPVYKEKLRLRSYGVPKRSDNVFLELKKKLKGVVYKRRVSLTLEEARRYLVYHEQPRKESQILHEIDWFLQRYQPVPKIYIAYDRMALFWNEDKNLRITFDQNILFRESLLDLSKGNWGKPLLKTSNVLMEIKIPGAMPLWLSRILNELGLYPTSFSKYGNIYKEHLLQRVFPKGGNYCA
jgi:hypothetical protein